jgi:predicted enzyme related to lactoylglutathione lyase
MKTKYFLVYVDDMDKELAFYIEKLHFKNKRVISLPDDKEGILLQPNNGGHGELCLCLIEKSASDSNLPTVILNTENCLKEFHYLKYRGVKAAQLPRYISLGLSAGFSDGLGNKFLLLEERDYSEVY